jgi:hypothetical protein
MSKCRCRINLLICEFAGGAPLELKHDPEEWKPVFRKGHAQTKRNPKLVAFYDSLEATPKEKFDTFRDCHGRA